MKKFCLIPAALLLLSLSGCLSSVYPYFLEEDRVPLAWLEGTWYGSESEGEETPRSRSYWHFAPHPDEPKAYRLTQVDGGTRDTVVFEVNPFQLDGQLYLDVALHDMKLENSLAAMTLFGTHFLLKAEREEGKLALWSFASEWVIDQIEAGAYAIEYEQPNDGSLLLTASTAELQKMIRAFADEPEAFELYEELRGE